MTKQEIDNWLNLVFAANADSRALAYEMYYNADHKELMLKAFKRRLLLIDQKVKPVPEGWWYIDAFETAIGPVNGNGHAVIDHFSSPSFRSYVGDGVWVELDSSFSLKVLLTDKYWEDEK